MGKEKLKNEKNVLWSFIFVSSVILLISAIFFFSSLKKEELGGLLITSMLLFMSAYALFVFIGRIVRYNRITKIQNAIYDEKLYTIHELKDKFVFSDKTLIKDLEFMLKNGYLGNLKYHNGRFVDPKEEEEKANRVKEEIIRYKEELKKQVEASQSTTKPKKKRIVSEKCPNCGAKVDFVDGTAECPYCGNSLNKV